MKKGFTLIELLAVIVILAIIAVIAVPIILNIINDSKENASLRSAEFYLDAVEMAVANATLNGTPIEDGTYKILENGNICLGYEKDGVTCVNEIRVEVNGEIPKENSKVTIINGQIKKVKLKYEEKEVVKDEKNQIVYLENKYTIGQPVTFDPGDGIERTWNVIDEDGITVTLMLTENLGNTVAWYVTADNSYGPKDALNYLNSLTINWKNVDPIESYSYINNLNGTTKENGYQKLEIKNGITKLTYKDGTTTELQGKSKARILTIEEVLEIASKTVPIFEEKNLRDFIDNNFEEIKTNLQEQTPGATITTIDEVIDLSLQTSTWLQYESKYIQIYYIVLGFINKGIGDIDNINLPSYLYQNLNSDKAPYAYWTLSSYASDSVRAFHVCYLKNLYGNNISTNTSLGVRPVITISKSKISKQ